MNYFVFGKSLENVRNHRDIKIVTNNRQKAKLVSEPNYHTTKHISEDLLIIVYIYIYISFVIYIKTEDF